MLVFRACPLAQMKYVCWSPQTLTMVEPRVDRPYCPQRPWFSASMITQHWLWTGSAVSGRAKDEQRGERGSAAALIHTHENNRQQRIIAEESVQSCFSVRPKSAFIPSSTSPLEPGASRTWDDGTMTWGDVVVFMLKLVVRYNMCIHTCKELLKYFLIL